MQDSFSPLSILHDFVNQLHSNKEKLHGHILFLRAILCSVPCMRFLEDITQGPHRISRCHLKGSSKLISPKMSPYRSGLLHASVNSSEGQMDFTSKSMSSFWTKTPLLRAVTSSLTPEHFHIENCCSESQMIHINVYSLS